MEQGLLQVEKYAGFQFGQMDLLIGAFLLLGGEAVADGGDFFVVNFCLVH